MEIYLNETEKCCDNCKTKVFRHLFEMDFNPKLARLLEPITHELAKSVLSRLGAPTSDEYIKYAMETFPKIHADFIDAAKTTAKLIELITLLRLRRGL